MRIAVSGLRHGVRLSISQLPAAARVPQRPRLGPARWSSGSSSPSSNYGLGAAVPPPPSSLPKSRPPTGKWTKRALFVLGGIGVVYAYDKVFQASAIARSSRCVVDLLIVGLDYKFNFVEGKDIEQLHERSADRMYNLLISNKGLYIKMGQAVAIQQGVFPPVFQEKFERLFDAAPQDSWAQVEHLLTKEYGEHPDQFFEYIDHRAIASASIAQVHRAKLKTGEWVAVKVQHSDIAKQVWWDLSAYKWVMYIYDRFLFKLPIYFVAEHVAETLEKEIDFRYEVQNSQTLRGHLEQNKRQFPNLYIPKVYERFCTNRVIVTEWIDGITMTNQRQVERGFNVGKLLSQLMNFFGRQVFDWGSVHCDPHPGNLILRRLNGGSGPEQLVLVDHGLYIYESEKFRGQYARLWSAMLSGRVKEVTSVATEWGFGNTDLFASSIVLQPYGSLSEDGHSGTPGQTSKEGDFHDAFREQDEARQMFQSFLKDTTKIPLELIFLGRTMRILQGLNKRFGSPVNRIRVFGYQAVQVVRRSHRWSIGNAWTDLRDRVVFWFTITVSDLFFALTRAKQLLFGSQSLGLEDLLDDQFRRVSSDMATMK